MSWAPPLLPAIGQLAHVYGFTQLDGSRPDIWRYIEEVREPDREANPDDYR
jgi:hypothetical protein